MACFSGKISIIRFEGKINAFSFSGNFFEVCPTPITTTLMYDNNEIVLLDDGDNILTQ